MSLLLYHELNSILKIDSLKERIELKKMQIVPIMLNRLFSKIITKESYD